MENMENNLNWEEIGLLDGLPENRKKNVADAFTITYEYVLSMPSKDGQYETLAFPIIRRIVGNFDLNKEQIIEIIEEFREAIKNFDWTVYDEASFVDLFVSTKINNLKIKYEDNKN